MNRFVLSCVRVAGFIALLAAPWTMQGRVATGSPEQDKVRIQRLEERMTLLEETLRTLLADRAATTVAIAPAEQQEPRLSPPEQPGARPFVSREMPPELLPQVGQIGAEVGVLLSGSLNPYKMGDGRDVSGFIDLPLFDRPRWLHGKVSYEISIGLTRAKATFATTSNVAQVANLTVLNAINPAAGLQNVIDSVTGTGAAPFPVTAPTVTTMKVLQVIPFSLKYTTNALDRWRLRPYGLIGFGTYVTIHEQSPTNTGVRPDAGLPPSAVALIGQVFGGQSPFGGPLVAGQIAQSPELETRGLPSGHGNFDLGWITGGGVEFRVTRNTSFGFDGRWNRIAGAPGSLFIYGARIGVHF